MSNPKLTPKDDQKTVQTSKRNGLWGLILVWIVVFAGLGMVVSAFVPPRAPYALSRSLWYADFRFWPGWMAGVCWLTLLWAVIATLIGLFMPQHEERLFLLRRSFAQNILSLCFVFFIWSTWYNYATVPLGTLFAPILSPVTNYLNIHYTLPLADYYTNGTGSNPLFGPAVGVAVLSILFVTWRVWHYVRRWKQGRTTISLLILAAFPIVLGADDTALEKSRPDKPRKVETSVGIYDVKSKDEIQRFTAEEVRELVRMEDKRVAGASVQPHPILVYCFEERSFQYTGGKYDNAEIKYRLHVPKNIKAGKKYPLAVHLHGIGEAGDNTPMSLAHLHSLLPLMIGPEQEDFFLLVLQCPSNDRQWNFKEEKDGNLDVVRALTDHVVRENPVDEQRLSVFGLSSGGAGVWELILANPEKFAAAVPVSSTFPGNYKATAGLNQTAIWSFINHGDGGVVLPPIHAAMQLIDQAGGFVKLTQFDLGGHAAWRPAMDKYNCFSWMIAQKRGGWFNPPPERKIYRGRSLSNSFFAFFLPLTLAGGLFLFQQTALCENLHEKIADKLYRRWNDDEYEDDQDDEYEDDDEDDSTDDFQTFTDITGTKTIIAKVLEFQGEMVKLQLQNGKTATVAVKNFAETDRNKLQKTRQERLLADGYRTWSNHSGTKSFVGRFIAFQDADKAQILSSNGKTAFVPISQLGEEEQLYLQSLRSENTVTEGK